jgi:DNA-binding transcriptional MerR regulator
VDLVPIGSVARQSGLTVKALRHYDTLGLLPPARVDPVTRHRWYAPDQLDRARRIRRLRALELPLADVRAVLAAPDGGRERLVAYRRDVEARLTRDQRILHGLVHLIEGDDMTADRQMTDSAAPPERQLAADLFNLVWTLLEQTGRTVADDDRMVHAAHASRYHWGQVPAATPAHLARGEWQISRVYTVLGRGEPALHHAGRVLDICQENGIGDWDLAFAYEALARAHAVAGDAAAAREYTDQALAAAEDISGEEDRELVLADLETIPGQPRYW